MEKRRRRLLMLKLALLLLINIITFSKGDDGFIGVNYGEVADNLPPPSVTANLLVSTSISKLRLYNADPALIQSLANTGISIVIGTSNSDIPTLASSLSSASQWVSTNLLPFIPQSAISTISVGNEVLNAGDPSLYSLILPAMQNLQAALPSSSGIKISTVHSMAVMSQSNPPSSGSFHPDLLPYLNPILGFLQANGGPFMINPYPYFAYRDDPRPDTLAFCLFQPNAGRLDPNTMINYINMFDAQVDAVKSALNSAGFSAVEIVVAETGWPYKGDDGEVGATVENAMSYNGNLVSHLRSMVGTPLMPGKPVDTYIFALYDEDMKPGPTSERSFGLFRTDLTMIYDAGLAKSGSSQLNPQPSTSTSGPSQVHPVAQPAVDCRSVGAGNNCDVSNSIGLQADNLVHYILVDQILNQLFVFVFCRTFGFLLTFVFYVTLPLLLLS